MNVGEGVDHSPLLANGESQALDGRSFEQDAPSSASAVPPTTTDFREAPSIVVDDPSGPSSSSSHPFRHPVRSARSYVARLSSVFSGRFLAWVAVQQFSLGGGVMTLAWSIGLPLFRGLGIDASRQQMCESRAGATVLVLKTAILSPRVHVDPFASDGAAFNTSQTPR